MFKLDESAYIKIIISVVSTIVIIVAGLALDMLGSMKAEIGQMSQAVKRIRTLDGLRDRVVKLEQSRTIITHAQLSSAISQFYDSNGSAMKMEIVDSLHGIDFNPRRDATHIRIKEDGSYLFLIAPQVRRVKDYSEKTCVTVWLRISGKDLANSSVKECFSENTNWKTTGVLMLQGILPMKKNETVEVMMRSEPSKKGGAAAIELKGIPLVPSTIVSVIKVG